MLQANGRWKSMQTGVLGIARPSSRVVDCAPESEKPRPYSVPVSLPAWQHEHPWLGAALPGLEDLGTFLQWQRSIDAHLEPQKPHITSSACLLFQPRLSLELHCKQVTRERCELQMGSCITSLSVC